MYCWPACLLRLPAQALRLALALGAVLSLTACPGKQPDSAATAPGDRTAAPPAAPAAPASPAQPAASHFAAGVSGIDNGVAVAGRPAQELVSMLQQLKLNPDSIHKAQEADFPPEWPDKLLLPQNCYIDTDRVAVFNPVGGAWQSCLLINSTQDKMVEFFKAQFEKLGEVTVEPGPDPTRSTTLYVQPPGGKLAVVSAIVAKSKTDTLWTLIYVELIPPDAPAGAGPAGNTSKGA